MLPIILLGDSHADIFQHRVASRFPNLTVVPTARRFANFAFLDLWSRLDPWLSQYADHTLVLCVNEIDIRVHYWRHLPRSGQSCDHYVKDLAQQLFASISEVVIKYKLAQCLLWGAPPAQARSGYNRDWPYCGPTQVRNKLIHLFNYFFHGLVRTNPESRVKFVTAFYDYVDLDFQSPNFVSSDGVHYNQDQADRLWDRIQLATLSQSMDLDFSQYPLQFEYYQAACADSQHTQYDAWLDLEPPQAVLSRHQCFIMDRTWYFVPFLHRSDDLWAKAQQLMI